ncbi:antirestriction protein ArdA, partial [Escherichia coli]|uniref:antirestriction protein ArdA n=1 Tax=Escherichia coli TaxID=562 RepID=UPI0039E02FF7
MTDITTPSVYVGTYHKYNCGSIAGAWLDLTDFDSSEEFYERGTVAKLAMRQPFVLFKGLTFQKLCLPGAFRPGD